MVEFVQFSFFIGDHSLLEGVQSGHCFIMLEVLFECVDHWNIGDGHESFGNVEDVGGILWVVLLQLVVLPHLSPLECVDVPMMALQIGLFDLSLKQLFLRLFPLGNVVVVVVLVFLVWPSSF